MSLSDLQKYFLFLYKLAVFIFLCTPSSTVATIFCSSWDESPTNFWISPVFSDFLNMALNDLVQPITAAVTSQVKLCPYDEEEPHIWFRLIKAQFTAAGIRSQKLKYANALPSLPKHVLRDILDTLDVCNDSDNTVAAAMTHRSRSPAPTSGKTTDKRNGNAPSKSRLTSRPAFHSFQNPANGVCKFHNYYSNSAQRCIAPCTFSEN